VNLMLDLPTILAWTALAAIVSLSPGPDVLLVANQAARRGIDAGLASVLGITVGGLWYMLLCGFGFLSILALSPALFTAVKIAGACYLAWLGVQLLRGAFAGNEETDPPSLRAPFRQGLLANLLNPKVAVFYLAVLPQFVGTGPSAPLNGMLLIAIHYAINAPWLALVAYGSDRAGTALRTSQAMRWVQGLLGAAFLGLAGKLAFARSH
jgi:threonine/homoserine/homoserine lactone efflux protein